MKNKFYILSIQPNTQVEEKALIQKLDIADDWIQIFPYTFIFTSNRSSKEWFNILKPVLDVQLFFISEISNSNRQGWIPKWAWDRLKQGKNSFIDIEQ